MSWDLAETVGQLVPVGRAAGILATVAVGGVMAGVGGVLGFGDYAGLPEKGAVLQVEVAEEREAIRSLEMGLKEIVCLVTLTATGEILSPLEVKQRLALVRRGELCI